MLPVIIGIGLAALYIDGFSEEEKPKRKNSYSLSKIENEKLLQVALRVALKKEEIIKIEN